ncbi:head decoration protein [Pseudonocardia sp. 73-21]|uniref:head decoration protein n=1 Tax=Pseudonocardia sp. 73-21 TaxID=1895809 RepID=UPI00095D49FA|nr:head decoration protein [Pseudonocardia sp. 73-21]OJY47608.1 MAG: K structural protein [Pseudonocardia sp. 73-21]
MDLSIRTETFGQEDQSWLGSAHGTDSARSITLDMTTFTAGTHYPDGYLMSGLPLGKITASGKYGLYDDAASDGRQACAGLLFTVVRAPASTSTPVSGAMLVHCIVVDANLPIAVDAAGKADVAGRIIFV